VPGLRVVPELRAVPELRVVPEREDQGAQGVVSEAGAMPGQVEAQGSGASALVAR
jgi:hypothetical protein